MPEDTLVWTQLPPDTSLWLASTRFGCYRVWQASGTCWMHPPGWHRGMPCSPDLEFARALAEEHYRQTLRLAEDLGLLQTMTT